MRRDLPSIAPIERRELHPTQRAHREGNQFIITTCSLAWIVVVVVVVVIGYIPQGPIRTSQQLSLDDDYYDPDPVGDSLQGFFVQRSATVA